MRESATEEKYWDNGPIYARMPEAGGFGIEATADKIGMVALGVTAAGIAAHAVATNLRKKQVLDTLIEEGKESEKQL
jgi:hydrogenase small subunit